MSDSTSQLPPIRTFQFDTSAVASLDSNVNQFRGDINLTQALLAMPGRLSGDGLDISVSLLYQSNVYRDAMTWNRDAPTSIAGLGWTLPATLIELDDGGAPTPGTRQYTYVSGGIPTPLAREPETSNLFAVDALLANDLEDGQPVPAALRAEFVRRGFNLSSATMVSATSSTAWTLSDDDNQQLFDLALVDTQLQVLDGGEAYQLVNYAFRKILYYPPYERWVVVNEDGHRMSFGGLEAPTAQGYATSVGNSIEWGIRWSLDGGAASAIWEGASDVTSGQCQYARVWHLAVCSVLWGDSIAYGYNEWVRDPSTGLIPDVEQPVGAGGLPYTKACYLTSITDVFGRKAVFQYGDKLWDDSTPESAREYADPHKLKPDMTANAYQDRYETKFLEGIAVQDVTGASMFSLALAYLPSQPAGGDDSPVANVTSYAGALYGDTCKRFLTGVTFQNASGEALPGLIFDYYFDTSLSGSSPGALKSITYPQGAVATYTYTQQQLAVCERMVSVGPPSDDFQGAEPRAFFGSDYVVTTWYNTSQGTLSLQVYTWLGRWIEWSLTDDTVLFSSADGLDLTTLNVVASENFFALSFTSSSETDLYVFQKDVARPGQWVPATVDGTTTAPNQPTRSYAPSGGTVDVIGGNTFLLVVCMDPDHSSYGYDRLTWRWTTASWTLESFTLSQYAWATAMNEYQLILDETGKAELSFLSPGLVWSQPAILTLPDFSFVYYDRVTLVPSASFVVMSNLQTDNSQSRGYELTFLQWDAAYAFPSTVTSFTFNDRLEASGSYKTPYIPTIIGNTMVAVAAHVLRYNGQTWLENSQLVPASLPSGSQQRYAYGPDYAIQIMVPGGGVGTTTAKVLSFDPDADSSSWTRSPVTPAQGLSNPPGYSATANWPSAGGGDFMNIGQYLYFRGTATDWDDVLTQSPNADLQQLVNQALGSADGYVLNAESVINEGPTFLGYYVYDIADSTNDQAAVLVLKNGGVYGAAQTLSSERIYTPAESVPTTPGQTPGGPEAFAAYPSTDSDFDHASAILLHRYAGDAIDGALTHYAVTSISITDGFGATAATTYFPDPDQAACDPTGLVVKYYEVTTYPGTADASQPTYGSKVTRYLNGLAVATGADYYNMLDGLLQSAETLDSQGNLLAQTQNTWQAYTTRASDPSDPEAPLLNLKGAYVLQIQQIKMEDGVASTQTTGYVPDGLAAPFSGQPVSTQTLVYGGSGAQETFTTTTTYGYEIDATLLAQHMLTKVTQSTTSWASGNAAAVPIKATAMTYAGFPSSYGQDVLVPAREATFAWTGTAAIAFPFSSYNPGSVPDGWLRNSLIQGRTTSGQLTEMADACGVIQSTLYGTAPELPIARITNASLSRGECAYLGFEPYESNAAWTMQGTQLVTGDAHSGTNSLSLPGGGTAMLTTTLTPANISQNYLLGFWYKTPAGFSPGNDAGFSVVVMVDGLLTEVLGVSFDDTGGAWTYRTLGIPLIAGQRSIELIIQATNTAEDAVLIDDVLVTPLASKVSVRAYDTPTHQVTAMVDSAGHTLRCIYDSFQRLVAKVGPQEQVKELVQVSLSRAGNATDIFDAGNPNANLSLEPADGGTLETFCTGDEWQDRWQASATSTNWNVSGGALSHTASVGDTLTWQGSSPATSALYFEVLPLATLAGPLAVSFAQGYQLAFDPNAGYSFTDPNGKTVQTPLTSPPQMATEWLTVFGGGLVLFFGDGQLLFSASVPLDSLDPIAISTGPNLLSFRNLAMVAAPRVSLSYTDASGQDRQKQQLLGQDAAISATIHDPLGRTVAVTRMAPASFGADAALPVLSYHPDFVDVSSFLAAMDGSWEMTGDLADYYAGQSDGTVPRSDDEGYPYFGYLLEASPRKRRLEQGQPGKAYAIHDIDSTAPADRQTTQFLYGPNDSSAFDLPQGDYVANTLISPLKTQSLTLRDTMGRKLASSLTDIAGEVAGQGQAIATFADAAGAAAATLQTRQPNFYTKTPQSDPSSFVKSLVQDPLGRTLQTADPDTGTSQFLYDPSSRLRFVNTALEDGEAWFAYYKYDALGRVLEEGTVQQAWDATRLATLVGQAAWPDDTVAHTVARTHGYDGDGSDPNAIGKEILIVTVNQAPALIPSADAVTTTESLAYDGDGNLASITLQLPSTLGTSAATVSYTYNNLKQITQVTYPDGSPVATVLYDYDDGGRVTRIGTSVSTPTDIAAYTYNADGDVETETLNQGLLTGAYQYASPGWLTGYTVTPSGTTDACFTLGLGYDADGRIESRGLSYSFGSDSDSTQVAYAYDGQMRLASATVTGGTQGNESVGLYDANGNIWKLTQDDVEYDFTCAPGSNRPSTLAIGSADPDPISLQFSADGRLTQAGGLALEYDPCLKLATGLTVTSGDDVTQLRLAYGGKGQRILKQVSGNTSSTTVYLWGAAAQPLCSHSDGTWTAYIQGPTGLVTVVSDARYFPVKDHAQTVWAVVDDQNALVARYDYAPFGEVLGISGSLPQIVPFRFMGKALDTETGLYDFGARLYHPLLRRFCSPDVAGQGASPYGFAGNNPIMMIDPTGNTSTWARVGIGAGMAALAVTGFALSFFTFGLSDVLAAIGDAVGSAIGSVSSALTGGSEVVAAGASVGAQGLSQMAVLTELSTTVALPEGVGAAGIEGTVNAVGNFLQQVVTNTAFGVGSSGLQYDISPGAQFSGQGFRDALLSGAWSGLLYGIGSGVAGLEAEAVSKAWGDVAEKAGLNAASKIAGKAAFKVALNVAMGSSTNAIAQIMTNLMTHQSWNQGLALAAKVGVAGGVPFGVGDVLLNDAKNWATEFATSFGSEGQSRVATAIRGVDQALKAAKSNTAVCLYGITGYTLAEGYVIWGATNHGK
ncbi:hypothetical protein G6M50_12110 [Agrobacterium rhizogenes]|nr:hypothetical protein [Rhizobium rhizogenes]NTJ78526.1 hypothetical protein [Rhizobium rhizogenes]